MAGDILVLYQLGDWGLRMARMLCNESQSPVSGAWLREEKEGVPGGTNTNLHFFYVLVAISS